MTTANSSLAQTNRATSMALGNQVLSPGFHPIPTLPRPNLWVHPIGASGQRMGRLLSHQPLRSQLISQNFGSLRSMLPVVTVVPVNRSSHDSAKNNQWAQYAWLQRCGWLRRKRRSVRSKQIIYQIRINDQVVIEVLALTEAEIIAQRLRQTLRHHQFDPSTLEPAIINGLPSGKADQDLLFLVSTTLSQRLNQNAELIAIAWINNLRIALDAEPLSLVEAQSRLYNLAQTGETVEGIASWYGPEFHGRPTATGEIFDEDELTAAHSSLPFNTFLKVTNLKTGVSVIVRVNDRGPYIGKRSLDLSRAAARCVGSETAGLIPYRAVILRSHPNQSMIKGKHSPQGQPLTIADQRVVK